MQPTVYQKPEIRDANDNIIQQGAFGKNTALANATNDGWIDYVANDLEFLYDLAKDEVVPVPSLPASGQTNKTYLLTTTGVSYRWSGTEWVAVSSSEAVGRAESAALLAEQWANKTDGTVDGTEYSAKYYAQQAEASADDAQDVADDMATHLVQIDKNTGGVAKNSKRISNIEKLLQGNLYDYDTDDDSAYTKTVPSGALPYAGVEMLGGKTLVMNQLVNSGATTVATISGHKYYTLINGTANIVTSSGSAITIVDDTADMVCDLTLMFGSGNEPSTVAEVEAMFPADYYPYNAGTLLSAGVTEVESKDSNDVTLQTLPIPAEVQALDGYGWSAEMPGSSSNFEVGNYIDFERKKFVQCVDSVDLGTLTWTRYSSNYHLWYANIPTRKQGRIPWTGYPKETLDYRINFGSTRDNDKSWTVDLITSSYPTRIYINNSAYDNFSGTDVANDLSGKIAYYELATPIETDISQYLTDNLIEVGAGGTLTFPNANGDDYHIPVPSDVTYMIDLQEAISNG